MTPPPTRRSLAAAVVAAALAALAAPVAAAGPAEEFFENKVRPVLADHCYGCHGPKKQMAGLRLDTADGLKRGADGDPVVSPGKPEASKLIAAVKRSGDYPMPPDKPLPADAVAALTEWVRQGAVFPASVAVAPGTKPAARDHWAFRPVADPPVPAVRGPQSAIRNPLDAFLLAKLQEKGLTFSPPADRRTLLRRVSFDLTGLPPTADEADAFAADPDPRAFEKAVDKLLASPHYGERWGRHWLDVARYADTKGYVFQEERSYPYAYTYRDYVVRSFNEDKPFDRFVVEQLAADRLDLGADKRPLAALGYLTLGRRFLNNTHDIIDDRIDVVTRGLLGLTVGCARCHDHKYDPIPAADYYSLYGVFASSNEPADKPLIAPPGETAEYQKFQAEVAKREKELADGKATRTAELVAALRGLAGGPAGVRPPDDRIFNRADRDRFTGLKRKLDAFVAQSPAAPPRAMALADNPTPTQPVVFVRGNPGNRGPAVPRRFLEVVAGPDRKPFPKDSSGRLELAKAIADPTNPLTARVFVNRAWGWHFGRGLVATPSDFGTRADPPTHPELLDYLAARFVEDGWSVKKLHRRILLSAAYQQSSAAPAAVLKADPENRLLGRQNRRRLEFEPLRDSLLAAAGRLDRTVYGRSADLFKAPYPTRRAVYGYIDRQNLPGTFRAFDFAGPDQHVPQRYLTTVPQQALYLMNSPFVAEQATAAAARKEVAGAESDAARVRALYRAVLGRNPTAEETRLGVAFAADAGPADGAGQLGAWELFAQALLLTNEFAFVD